MLEIVAMISDISVIIASVITSWAVIKGFSAWKKEFAGKRNIELAEDTLALLPQFEEAISHMRSVGSCNPYEGSTRPCNDKEEPSLKQTLDSFYRAQERYNLIHKDLLEKISLSGFIFKARFGDDKDKPFNELNKVITDILAASRYCILFYKRGKLQESQEYQKIIWEDKGDEIQEKVKGIIKNIEEICKNIKNGKSL